MITGKLDDGATKSLAASLPWIDACLGWLREQHPWTEKTEMVCEGIMVKKVEYGTTSPSTCRFENHDREIDLQFVVEGIEWIEITRPEDLGEAIDRDTGGDVVFYAAPDVPVTRLLLGEGSFAVFFPEDVHRCGASVAADARLRKYVFKISRAAYSL